MRPYALLPIVLLLTPGFAWAASETEPALLRARPVLSQVDILQRGARLFVNYCLGCHAAAYMRYERMGADLEIPVPVLRSNFMLGAEKLGETMAIAMSQQDGIRYFNVAPPDLSLVARSRGADWLYTYLRGFYADAQSPTGVNNLVFKGTAMPHVFWELQGLQEPVYRDYIDAAGKERRVIDHLELATPGTMSEKEFSQAMRDLVSFLVYLGEPAQLKRKRIGIFVIFYLLILAGITYWLKKEYWKDVA